MSNQRILYVTTELFPYQEKSSIGVSVSKMALKMYQGGNDVRVFMPRFGSISERKFQLHEVIRLSGMNIIVNDMDQPLIIKVASLPGERLQVYFIDNDEYFKRKQYYCDEQEHPFEDNDERAIFFARGVIETIKRLNWVPDIIHFNGWMSSFIPVYLRTFYKKDSYFNDTRLVLSVYNEQDISFGKKILEKLKFDNITELKALSNIPCIRNFVVESMDMVDLILKGDKFLEEDLERAYKRSKTDKREYMDAEAIMEIYNKD